MPIRPENSKRYPKNWQDISARIRERAGNRCEECGIENKTYRENSQGRMVLIVLTVAHLDHTPENCSDENLRAWCQRCHNRYDLPHRQKGIQERARAKLALGDLFSPKPCSLLELSDETCRWPIGEGASIMFCGLTAKDGKPYCTEHCSIAYKRDYGFTDERRENLRQACTDRFRPGNIKHKIENEMIPDLMEGLTVSDEKV